MVETRLGEAQLYFTPKTKGFSCQLIASALLEGRASSASQAALMLGRSVLSFVLSDAFLIKMVIIGAFCKVLLGEFAFLQALP